MKTTKRILSLIIAVVMFLLSFANFSAAEVPAVNFVLLGDSVASGYGLTDLHDSYGVLIAKEKQYDLYNDAVPGHTTTDLLNVVRNEKVARNDIKNADLIAISICGNDLIQFMANANASTLLDIYFNGVNAASVKTEAAKVTSNLQNICNEIRSLNSDAPVIFQLQYNPLYANDQYSSYASTAEKLVPVFAETFSNLQKSYSNIFIADTHAAFDNYYKEAGNYDVIQADGIHPSVKGHALIADVLLEVIGELEAKGLVPVAAKAYYMLGDSDSNQRISISDATVIQKVLAGILTYEGDVAKLCMDADEDGKVTVKDATAIQKHLASIPTNKNIGSYMPYYG